VTDAGLKELAVLKGLQSLGLWRTQVTNVGLNVRYASSATPNRARPIQPKRGSGPRRNSTCNTDRAGRMLLVLEAHSGSE
jgi:hypothetical protein